MECPPWHQASTVAWTTCSASMLLMDALLPLPAEMAAYLQRRPSVAERLRIRVGARPSQLQRTGGATGSDPITGSPNIGTGSPTLRVPLTTDAPGSARGSARAAAAAGGPPRQQSGRMHVPSTARHPGAAALKAAREKQVSCSHTP